MSYCKTHSPVGSEVLLEEVWLCACVCDFIALPQFKFIVCFLFVAEDIICQLPASVAIVMPTACCCALIKQYFRSTIKLFIAQGVVFVFYHNRKLANTMSTYCLYITMNIILTLSYIYMFYYNHIILLLCFVLFPFLLITFLLPNTHCSLVFFFNIMSFLWIA